MYFGSVLSSTVIRSCFTNDGLEGNYQYEYDLLVIPLPGEQREDYERQDIVERRCRTYAKVNATVRSPEIIQDLLKKGSSFYEDRKSVVKGKGVEGRVNFVGNR